MGSFYPVFDQSHFGDSTLHAGRKTRWVLYFFTWPQGPCEMAYFVFHAILTLTGLSHIGFRLPTSHPVTFESLGAPFPWVLTFNSQIKCHFPEHWSKHCPHCLLLITLPGFIEWVNAVKRTWQEMNKIVVLLLSELSSLFNSLIICLPLPFTLCEVEIFPVS